ncbi:MAG: ABC transporter ATP-binding protein [Actinomycetota bacterium]|nr:ABC transporter ATP-binding protein [Actinomycetota bacterium]
MTAAIDIEAISKRFRLYHERPDSMKERILRFRGTRAEDFWALRDVTHRIAEGQTVGLVGANGSGKTTLLKIIGGILRPTEGRVTTRGRIAALLALGAGFHPELTGRENVYLNASILGLSKRETDRHFDDIVQFAELERFIDNQVKFYSSGMYVRLGFAVAVHVDPSILLVDEVLAVGDEAFQRKCLARVRDFQRDGRTIVFVTHAVELVREICDQAIMLDRGHVRVAGDVGRVIKEFRLVLLQEHAGFARADVTREVEIAEVELLDGAGRPGGVVAPGDTLAVQVELRAARPVDDPAVSIAVYDADDRFLYGTSTDRNGVSLGRVEGKIRVTFELRSIPFVEGRYLVTVGAHARDMSAVHDWHDQRYAFDIAPSPGHEKDRLYIPSEVRVERL